tara:strand:- start:2586 stop:3683 length:1098 start_codon:yes stop_codon:yes gene_type:complete
MKALVYEEFTRDDDFKKILKVKDLDIPKPASHDVIFKVKATALNYNDIWGMRGNPVPVPLPHISGSDAAGEVIAIGDKVTQFQIGDRVAAYPNMSCKSHDNTNLCEACALGREYDCENRIVWGFLTGPLWGGFCEIAHLPEYNLVKIPDNLSYDDAASASMALLTSWHMLVGRAKITSGQTVLIMGGGSGVGSFGIQIAKSFGCKVIATSSPEKLEKCQNLGADYAVDHRKPNWHKKVRIIAKEISQETGKMPGIDVSFDHIGETHWNNQIAILKNGGTIVTCGATTGFLAQVDLRHVFYKGINILGATSGSKSELEQGFSWMSQGKIKPTIDSTWTFEEAHLGHKKMLNGSELFGKMLIKPENA